MVLAISLILALIFVLVFVLRFMDVLLAAQQPFYAADMKPTVQ